MIYMKRAGKSARDKFDTAVEENLYRHAKCSIRISNRYGREIVLEQGVLFSVSAKYVFESDVYQVWVKTYGLQNVLNERTGTGGTDSLFAVISRNEQVFSDSEYNDFMENINLLSDKAVRSVVESEMLKHPDIVRYCSESEQLREEYRKLFHESDMLKATADALKFLPRTPSVAQLWGRKSGGLEEVLEDLEKIRHQMDINSEKTKELRRQLDYCFRRVTADVFAKLSGISDTAGNTAGPENTHDYFPGREIHSAAEITETETRTDEEIRGGCARVMYPVYKKEQTPYVPASYDIPVTVKPQIKKVDLTKH